MYDWGGPDFTEGEQANLKWRLICQGVEALIERDGLVADDVAVLIDWQVRARRRLPCAFAAQLTLGASCAVDSPG